MENKNIKKTPEQSSKMNRTKWFIALTVIALVAYFVLKPNGQGPTTMSDNKAAPVLPTKPEPKVVRPDSTYIDTIIGKWKRTDGDYILEILKCSEDGKLEAAYYNPKSIHIGRALWAINENRLIVMVELKDANYPGSTYALQYIPEHHMLAGKYFQAMDKVTYDVGFIKEK